MRYTSHALISAVQSTISVISTLQLGSYNSLHTYRLSACYSGFGDVMPDTDTELAPSAQSRPATRGRGSPKVELGTRASGF